MRRYRYEPKGSRVWKLRQKARTGLLSRWGRKLKRAPIVLDQCTRRQMASRLGKPENNQIVFFTDEPTGLHIRTGNKWVAMQLFPESSGEATSRDIAPIAITFSPGQLTRADDSFVQKLLGAKPDGAS